MKAADVFEFATDADPARNYCLWDYQRPAPAEDKFRALNLLLYSFELAGALPRGLGIVRALRDGIGPFRTVFGVKWTGRKFAWEFYFYDYARTQREVSIGRVLAALAPFHRARFAARESLPYFMFSIDIAPGLEGVQPLDALRVYVGNPGAVVSSGMAYALRESGYEFENLYNFFDAGKHMREIRHKVSSSPHFNRDQQELEAIIWPQLSRCHTICLANKRFADCIYYSGVDIDQLLYFLQRLEYPAPLVAFARQNRDRFDHVLFDVGIDYAAGDAGLVMAKSGFYAVF